MYRLLLTLFFFSILIACKKKKEVVPINQLELITGGSLKIWILTDITQEGKSIITDCAKDDEYTFDKNLLTVYYNPQNKCYQNDDPRSLSFKTDDLLPIITIDGTEYLIDSITQKKMVISNNGAEPNSNQRIESILHHQQTLTLSAK